MSTTVIASELTNKDLIRIRDLVIQNRVALEKWSQVVDHLVPSSPTDELRIKFRLRKEHDDAEAVLDTLRKWQEFTQGKLPDLVKVIRHHELNNLAAAIEKEFESTETPVPWLTPPTWFDVGEIVPNFTGRDAELKALHEMLTGPRRDDSSAANLVAVCGLGGVGKSALARRYAYRQREFYGGNVIWISAESVDSMRLSFRRLAKQIGAKIPDPAIQDEQVPENGEPSTTPTEETPQETLLAAAVYERFNDRKCLFIFDNVEENDDFQLFQPKIADPSLRMPHILLTSRKTDLTQLPENRLNLGVLSMEDTIQLVQKQLKESTTAAARSLAEKLQSYPLDILATCEAKKDLCGPMFITTGLLAKTYSGMGDHDTALQIFNNLLPVLAHEQGHMSPQALKSMSDIADTLRHAGRLSEALEVLEHVHTGLVQVRGQDHVNTLLCKGLIGHLYYKTGRSEDGVQIFKEVYEALKEGLGENHPHTVDASLDLKRMLERIKQGK